MNSWKKNSNFWLVVYRTDIQMEVNHLFSSQFFSICQDRLRNRLDASETLNTKASSTTERKILNKCTNSCMKHESCKERPLVAVVTAQYCCVKWVTFSSSSPECTDLRVTSASVKYLWVWRAPHWPSWRWTCEAPHRSLSQTHQSEAGIRGASDSAPAHSRNTAADPHQGPTRNTCTDTDHNTCIIQWSITV